MKNVERQVLIAMVENHDMCVVVGANNKPVTDEASLLL